MRAPLRYRLLLLLLPTWFRRRHGAAMEAAFTEALQGARQRGAASSIALWLREIADLAGVGARMRRRGQRVGHDESRHEVSGRDRAGDPRHAAMALWTRAGDDLQFATRSLARNKGFTAFAALTLALGIGASTAMFSAVDGVMLHPLPYQHANRMVTLGRMLYGGTVFLPPSTGQIAAWRDLHDVFEDVEPFNTNNGVELTGQGDPVLLTSVLMRATMPAFLGVRPILGRSFSPAETADSTSRVALISSALWKSRFGGGRSVLGRTLHLNGELWTIVGVMPADAGTPDGSAPDHVDVWQPLPDEPPLPPQVVARLREGVTVQQAQKRLDEVDRSHAGEGSQPMDWQGAKVFAASTYYHGGIADSLRVLMAAVTLLLLVACVNVANLLLSRAHTRSHEMAVRAALGAGGGRLVRQALLESVLMGVGGGGLGLAFAWGALHALASLRPEQLAALQGLHVDGRVAAFAAFASVAAALLFGVAPAVGMARARALPELTGGRRAVGPGRSAARFRWALVGSEVALSFALLVGSVMVLTSLARLASRAPGFDVYGLVDVRVMLPSWVYEGSTARRQAFESMGRAMHGVPGVKAVALTESVPRRMGAYVGKELRVEGLVRDSTNVMFRGGPIGTKYLDVLGEPLLQGRGFSEDDVGSPEHPVILGAAAARHIFRGASPIGRHFDLGYGGQTFTVVGVVRDILASGLADTGNDLLMYTPLDHVYSQIDFAVRATGDVDSDLLEGLRRAAQRVEPDAVVQQVVPMETLMAQSLARQLFTTSLLTAFGVLALLLSAAGLYGVVAQIVGQRTREIGIRMSLGAAGSDIGRMVLSAGAWATAAGLAAGLGLTLLGMHLLASQVFGLEKGNVAAYGVAAAVLALTALLASWVPARRAARVDPVEAIRTE